MSREWVEQNDVFLDAYLRKWQGANTALAAFLLAVAIDRRAWLRALGIKYKPIRWI